MTIVSSRPARVNRVHAGTGTLLLGRRTACHEARQVGSVIDGIAAFLVSMMSFRTLWTEGQSQYWARKGRSAPEAGNGGFGKGRISPSEALSWSPLQHQDGIGASGEGSALEADTEDPIEVRRAGDGRSGAVADDSLKTKPKRCKRW